ncbi:MAG: WD40 repeat domain-containing protein [Planctomycetes bacterium]|nr:WD40 repeat domain-containing protein [Planctomycetota bacterium]
MNRRVSTFSVSLFAFACAAVRGSPARLAIPVGPPSPRGAVVATAECIVAREAVVPVTAVAFAPDAETLAAAGAREVLLWDLEGARLAKRFDLGDRCGSIHALAFSPDGRFLAVAGGMPRASGATRILDAETGEDIRALDGPKDVVHAVAWSPDGRLLAAGSADGSAYVWSLPAGKLEAALGAHGAWVLGVSFDGGGKWLATAGADRTARVWDAATWQPARTLLEPDAVNAVAFSPDGSLVAGAVGGPDMRAVRIEVAVDPSEEKGADARKKAAARARRARTLDAMGGIPLEVAWSADGRRVFAACSDGALRIFNATGGIVATSTGHADWVYALATSPDGARIATGSADGTVKLWAAADGAPLATLVQLFPRADAWLAIAAEGFFATSEEGAIEWKAKNPGTPPERLAARFRNAARLKEALAGKRRTPAAPARPVPRKDARPVPRKKG